jgi:hypothetical protein
MNELTLEQLMAIKKDLEWQLKQVRKEIRQRIYSIK